MIDSTGTANVDDAVCVKYQICISRCRATKIETGGNHVVIWQADAQSVSLNLKFMCWTLFLQIDIELVRFLTLLSSMGFLVKHAFLQTLALLIR